MIPEVSSPAGLPSNYTRSLFFRTLGLELRAPHKLRITVPLSSVASSTLASGGPLTVFSISSSRIHADPCRATLLRTLSIAFPCQPYAQMMVALSCTHPASSFPRAYFASLLITLGR